MILSASSPFRSFRIAPAAAMFALIFSTTAPANAQLALTLPTFDQETSQMQMVHNYTFGTDSARNVNNLTALASSFSPYGIAGTIVINQEWERYQPFNNSNFVFTPNSLQLTATIPQGGGLFPGGINSAQIWSNWTIAPQMTGYSTYAIEVRMKTPPGQGMWPAAWFFSKYWNLSDTSEIDNPEFFSMQNQTPFDWTANIHGPGAGDNMYSIKTNPWVWHPGLNFAADYHEYQTLWTPTSVCRFVDGTLVLADHFKWTSPGPAQLGVNLAVGSGMASLPGLKPTSLSEFPAVLAIDHITVWAK